MLECFTVDGFCPCCGERITLVVDGSVEAQTYTEDCEVCCAPMLVQVRVGEEGASPPTVRLTPENS